MFEDFDLISRYSRAQAIADGVLIDVTEVAREAGITYPTAITAAVHASYVRVPDGVTGQDEHGRLWDLVFMLRFAITRHPNAEGDMLVFTVFVRNVDDDAPQPVKLKAICHPGDSGEPVVTVLLPDED
jgi:hypothetical protein